MRTLLAESSPPNWGKNEGGRAEIAALANDSPEAAEAQRTFLEGPVLASGADLTEVGVDGKITPSASRAENVAALGRDMAGSFRPAAPPGSQTQNEIPFAA